MNKSESHIKSENGARDSITMDREIAKKDGSVKVLTMVLQSLLICHCLEARSLYYKMKLSCHNFTIYDLTSHEAMNFFCHEGEGSKRS